MFLRDTAKSNKSTELISRIYNPALWNSGRATGPLFPKATEHTPQSNRGPAQIYSICGQNNEKHIFQCVRLHLRHFNPAKSALIPPCSGFQAAQKTMEICTGTGTPRPMGFMKNPTGTYIKFIDRALCEFIPYFAYQERIGERENVLMYCCLFSCRYFKYLSDLA